MINFIRSPDREKIANINYNMIADYLYNDSEAHM